MGRAEVIGLRPAAREANVAPSTLQHWRQAPDMAQLRAEKKEDVAADVWGAFQKGVARVSELLETATDLSKVAIATGILYDKFALMTGDATSRAETLALTDGLDADAKRNLRRVFDRVAAAELAESRAD